MRNYTLMLILQLTAIITFGQTQNFDQNDVVILQTISNNATYDSPLKTEWANVSELATWAGVKWTDTAPKKVIELQLGEKKLLRLDVTRLNKLEILACNGNPQLTLLQVTGLTNLKYLMCRGGENYSDNKLTSLDLEGLVNLESLDCSGNLLTSLDLKDLTKLRNLFCDNNRLPFSSLKATLNMSLSPISKIEPQKEVFEDLKNIQIGDILDFSAEADVNGTATVFCWYKNGKKIEGTDQTGKYKVEESGTYYCTMTNANFPGLTLTTHSLILLPTVVDNSKWFPPVRSQEVLANCTHFSLIYYLKSSIWNKQFNRDPNLEINQFNHNFVWNQNNLPDANAGSASGGFMYMRNQGCATVADFLINEQTTYYKPDFGIRAKALAYKSKRFYTGNFSDCRNNTDLISKRIASLKDSLKQGKCFTLGITSYSDFFDLPKENSVYSWHKEVHSCSSRGHMFTIVGYNDTIKTDQGRGAFQVINSNKEVANGKFYYDYNWFYFDDWQSFEYCFLEEDFSSVPKLVMNLRLSNSIKSTDIENGNYIFTDTLVNQYNRRIDFEKYYIDCGHTIHDPLLENRDAKFDFENSWAYYFKRNTVQIIGLNNERIPLRNDLTTWPQYNDDGKYELVTDLTGFCATDKFKSLSVIVFDPLSSVYLDENDQTIYSYQREANTKIDQAFIDFMGTDKKIKAKVTELRDTSITTGNFYSQMAGWHLKPMKENIYVKSCTSVLKRKLIIFSVTDLETDTPPVFTQVPNSDLIATLGTQISFSFKANDPENAAITYLIASGTGASIDPVTGLFTYQANQTGSHSLIVSASDGVNSVSTTFNIKVNLWVNTPPVFTQLPNGDLTATVGELVKFDIDAFDPDTPIIYYSIISGSGALVGPTGIFYFQTSQVGTFQFAVGASDGINTIETFVNVKVNAAVNVGISEAEIPVFAFKTYPNPFTRNTAIEFTLVKRQIVKLSVFNSFGQQVVELANSELEVGTHLFVFDGKALPDGIYMGQMQTPDYTKTIKLIKSSDWN